MTHKHLPMNGNGEFWWKGRKQIGRGRGGEGRENSVERRGEAEGGRGGGWTSGGGEFPFFYVLHILSCGICTGK